MNRRPSTEVASGTTARSRSRRRFRYPSSRASSSSGVDVTRHLAALVDEHVEAGLALLELDRARVVEHLVAGDDALAVRRRHAPPDAWRPVAEALVQRVLEGEAAAEPPAQPGDPARAHRQVLVLGHAQRDRLLVRRVAARALAAAAEADVAAEPRALARADRAQLDAPVEPVAERGLELGGVGPALGLVGEDDPRAVEDELGGDGLELGALLLDHVAEDAHRPLRLVAVRGRRLVVDLGRPADDPLQRRARLAVQLVVRLDDAPELLAARRLADDLLVPGELEPARIERVDLPARREHDPDRDRHAGSVPPSSRRRRTKSASSVRPGWTLNSNERHTSRTVAAARSARGRAPAGRRRRARRAGRC